MKQLDKLEASIQSTIRESIPIIQDCHVDLIAKLKNRKGHGFYSREENLITLLWSESEPPPGVILFQAALAKVKQIRAKRPISLQVRDIRTVGQAARAWMQQQECVPLQRYPNREEFSSPCPNQPKSPISTTSPSVAPGVPNDPFVSPVPSPTSTSTSTFANAGAPFPQQPHAADVPPQGFNAVSGLPPGYDRTAYPQGMYSFLGVVSISCHGCFSSTFQRSS
jgi:hypothetical protein